MGDRSGKEQVTNIVAAKGYTVGVEMKLSKGSEYRGKGLKIIEERECKQRGRGKGGKRNIGTTRIGNREKGRRGVKKIGW